MSEASAYKFYFLFTEFDFNDSTFCAAEASPFAANLAVNVTDFVHLCLWNLHKTVKSTPSRRRKGRDCFLHRAAEIVRSIVYIHSKIKG
ncbi:MAG: hypothetical protein HP037_02505 [Subdoligranulum sp.]|nr:hypothetical protein [Subdoligranulum sp.]